MQKQKGFTIIELIVVIAIIAVLAAIVLVNVTQYITKAKNAAIRANMASIAVIGADYLSNNGSFNNFCNTTGADANPKMVSIQNAITNAGSPGVSCYCNKLGGCGSDFGTINTGWCACAQEITGAGQFLNFCVDSTGYKGETTGMGCAWKCLGGFSGGVCVP